MSADIYLAAALPWYSCISVENAPAYPSPPTLISIVGPTAVGKTALAIALARALGTEIISCDARQIYRYLDIGTAKPSMEERAGIPHHFIDYLLPDQPYTAGQYEQEAGALLQRLFQQYRVVVMVGGSTLYAHALWEGIHDMPPIPPAIRQQLWHTFEQQGLQVLLEELQRVDPETYARIDRQNHSRVIRALEVHRASGKPISHFRSSPKAPKRPYRLLKIGLRLDRPLLYQRIDQRVDSMLAAGLEDEVQNLLKMGYKPSHQALQSIGYQEFIQFFEGKIPQQEAIRLIKRNSRRYAKRQLTFYRRYEDIQWFEASEAHRVLAWVQQRI